MRNFPRFLATFRKNREFKASYVNLFVFFFGALCVHNFVVFMRKNQPSSAPLWPISGSAPAIVQT